MQSKDWYQTSSTRAAAPPLRRDVNGVNDPDAKRAMQRKVESAYAEYACNQKLIAEGAVRACSQGGDGGRTGDASSTPALKAPKVQ